MRKIGITIATIFLFTLNNYAQNSTAHSLFYKTSAGVTVWNGAGISIKSFMNEKNAIELDGFFNSNGTRISALYEIHGDLNTESNLKWFFGPGAHVSLYSAGQNSNHVGVDGIAGVDYKFRNLPLNLAIDWQPYFEFGSGFGSGAYGNFGGVACRYTF